MKRYLILSVAFLNAVLLPGFLPAQAAEVRDARYHIVSDGTAEDAVALLKELELRFDAYNQLFRFDPSLLESPLAVRVFHDQGAYELYLAGRAGEGIAGAVYLHYSRPDLRELVVHRGSPGAPDALAYHAFVQFFRAFISEPPAWMQEGLAVYLAALRYDGDAGQLRYEENMDALPLVQGLDAAALDPQAITGAGTGNRPEHFQALSWALVSFFLNAQDESYYRTFLEVFMALSPDAGEAANREAAARRIGRWTDPGRLGQDFRDYVAARKTFPDLLREGQAAYTQGDTAAAELCFLAALGQRPAHYAPYYYLGLLAYGRGAFDEAAAYYQAALDYGADRGLLNYALGLNAAARGWYTEARDRLEAAALADPARYAGRAADLLGRFPEHDAP